MLFFIIYFLASWKLCEILIKFLKEAKKAISLYIDYKKDLKKRKYKKI